MLKQLTTFETWERYQSHQSVSQSVSKLVSRSINQSINQSIINRSVSQSDSKSINQSISYLYKANQKKFQRVLQQELNPIGTVTILPPYKQDNHFWTIKITKNRIFIFYYIIYVKMCCLITWWPSFRIVSQCCCKLHMNALWFL